MITEEVIALQSPLKAGEMETKEIAGTIDKKTADYLSKRAEPSRAEKKITNYANTTN